MRPFTDMCTARLAEMVGVEYVDVYASEVKKHLEQHGTYPPGTEPNRDAGKGR